MKSKVCKTCKSDVEEEKFLVEVKTCEPCREEAGKKRKENKKEVDKIEKLTKQFLRLSNEEQKSFLGKVQV